MKTKVILKYIGFALIAYSFFFGVRLYSFFDFKKDISQRESRLISFYKNDLQKSIETTKKLIDSIQYKNVLLHIDSAMIKMLQYTNEIEEVITYNYDISQTILFITNHGQFISELSKLAESDSSLHEILQKHELLNEEQIIKRYVDAKYTVAETYHIFTNLRDDIRKYLIEN